MVTNKDVESRVDSLEKLVADSQAATQKSLQGLQQVVEGLISSMSVGGNLHRFHLLAQIKNLSRTLLRCLIEPNCLFHHLMDPISGIGGSKWNNFLN